MKEPGKNYPFEGWTGKDFADGLREALEKRGLAHWLAPPEETPPVKRYLDSTCGEMTALFEKRMAELGLSHLIDKTPPVAGPPRIVAIISPLEKEVKDD